MADETQSHAAIAAGVALSPDEGERIAAALARHYPFDRGEAVRVLEAKIDRLRAMVAEGEVAMQGWVVERMDLLATIERLQAANNSMTASTSWRVTAPMRRIVDRLRERLGKS